jgi:hypothetical protein
MTGIQAYCLWLRWCRRYGPSLFVAYGNHFGDQMPTNKSQPAAFRLLVKAGEGPMRALQRICSRKLYPNGQGRRAANGAVASDMYGRDFAMKIVARGDLFIVRDRAKIDRIFDLYEAFVLVGGFAEKVSVLEVAHDELIEEARDKAREARHKALWGREQMKKPRPHRITFGEFVDEQSAYF